MSSSEQAGGPFELSRCTAEDLPELIQLQYDSFPPAIRTLFMGCSTPIKPNEIERITAKYIKASHEDPNDIWIGVKDCATGKWIAGSNWRVYLNGEGGEREKVDESPEWLEGKDLEASQSLISSMTARRNKSMPGPYICR
jgi:redox-regulated HSP33 family molecular chaperone